MSFTKDKKVLYEDTRYNPPPNYYESAIQKVKPSPNAHSFSKGERFIDKQLALNTPGPGAFHNDVKDKVKKRILEQSKMAEKGMDNHNDSNIKISSIPSIPKKSATRVYEELAPGILILHQQEYENSNVGPGSYNINPDIMKKKVVCHRINPEHKKKFIDPVQQKQLPIPNLDYDEEIRQERRQMYLKGIVKSSAIERNMISPSDLCLEVIILREKLLRGEEVPPPGYYYNPNVHSSFKPVQDDKPTEMQLLAGKEERFKDYSYQNQSIGPGSYAMVKIDDVIKAGGFIPREGRNISEIKPSNRPGPGAYKLKGIQAVKVQPKGNYPPIFGSGSRRFPSAPKPIVSDGPGPGSYKIDGKRTKKTKYIKIRKEHYQSKLDGIQKAQFLRVKQNADLSQVQFASTVAHGANNKGKNTSSFSSKVDRFGKQLNSSNGADQFYDAHKSSVAMDTFNRNRGYIGGRNGRFDNSEIRPTIGPGTYDSNLDPVREKKINNILL